MENVQRTLWLIPLGAAALGCVLSGCADVGRLNAYLPAGVDRTSSAADAVATATTTKYPYPNLKALPQKPRDIRALAVYATDVKRVQGGRETLRTWVEANPAGTTDAEGFADATRAGVPQAQREIPGEDQAARTEAWAERLRRAAKPPPPPS